MSLAHIFLSGKEKDRIIDSLGERVTTYARKILQDVENIKVIGIKYLK
ncbi:MAG: hypothetical protein Ct9H90mP13_13760 [Pseudomonadota bacterium]|nr:MAG: hypothetical protein Ct9H90mP13_13760 [Pseudomonadota bacterium]